MQVEAAIDEADVGRLRVGMAASFAVDAFPRRSFNGEIRQIRKSPLNVQNVVSYTVVISAANPDMALLPGMTANVRIAVDSRASALKVPNAALRWRPAGAAADARQAAPADAPAQQAGGAGGAAVPRAHPVRAQAERCAARADRRDLQRLAAEVRAGARHEGRRRAPARGREHSRRDQRAHRRAAHAGAAPGLGAPAGRIRQPRAVGRRARLRARERRSPRRWTCASGSPTAPRPRWSAGLPRAPR